MALLYSTKGTFHCIRRRQSQHVIRPQECAMSCILSKHLIITMATFIVLIGGCITCNARCDMSVSCITTLLEFTCYYNHYKAIT